MDLKTLVASILAEVITADVPTIHALAQLAADELKLKREITPIEIEETLRELIREGLAAEYEETSLDLSRKVKKYIATDKTLSQAKALPPNTQKVAKLKYVPPTFYILLDNKKR